MLNQSSRVTNPLSKTHFLGDTSPDAQPAAWKKKKMTTCLPILYPCGIPEVPTWGNTKTICQNGPPSSTPARVIQF